MRNMIGSPRPFSGRNPSGIRPFSISGYEWTYPAASPRRLSVVSAVESAQLAQVG
jgi:hypothetical protein